jgi:hypothetical protein
MPDPLLQLDAKTFAAQLHTRFKVHAGAGDPVVLELDEILEPPSPPQVELFIVHFRGPRQPLLKQQIYPFEHEVLGAFDLFVTAIAADAQSTTYEAVFHRTRKKS